MHHCDVNTNKLNNLTEQKFNRRIHVPIKQFQSHHITNKQTLTAMSTCSSETVLCTDTFLFFNFIQKAVEIRKLEQKKTHSTLSVMSILLLCVISNVYKGCPLRNTCWLTQCRIPLGAAACRTLHVNCAFFNKPVTGHPKVCYTRTRPSKCSVNVFVTYDIASSELTSKPASI